MSLSEIVTTIVVSILAIVLMVLIPVWSEAKQNDEVSKNLVESITADWVYNEASKRKIDPNDYNGIIEELAATGMRLEVEIEVKHLDQNVGKKSVTTSNTLYGENEYISTYTTEILDTMYNPTKEEIAGKVSSAVPYPLKKGDILTVRVRLVEPTLGQKIERAISHIVGKDWDDVIATSTSMVN